MTPTYRFFLTADTTQQAFPNFGNNLSLDYALEKGERFYRGKLSGQLTFQSADYSFIVGKPFDTQFSLRIEISYNGGDSWATYWTGRFWKTDCEFDADAGTVKVTPETTDRYTEILDGMEKEFDLISLAPAIAPVVLDKRPMIQIYVAGSSAVACFLSGMWWEEPCEPVTNHNTLQNTYFFRRNKTFIVAEVSGDMTPELPSVFWGEFSSATSYDLTAEEFTLQYRFNQSTQVSTWTIIDDLGTILWSTSQSGSPTVPYTVTLAPVAGSGQVSLYVNSYSVYARYITDVVSAGTNLIPANDLVANNRNYTRVLPYDFPNNIYATDKKTTTPTEWGLYEPGVYYDYIGAPSLGIPDARPVARDTWGVLSIWFSRPSSDYVFESQWRKETTLKNAYPLWSVLSVLLGQVAPSVTHEESTDYSQFFYGTTNPLIGGATQRVILSPKSNLITINYDQPAQKSPVTLRAVLDMLRDCYRCYWFIDDQNRFRIEHISWFMRGEAYSGQPQVGIDLTKQVVTKNGKVWAFARDQYAFEKPDMPARYQFDWMDDVTQLFEGFPIDIISGYVQKDSIEQITLSRFTSDVDYILLNPSEISKDGLALLVAVFDEAQNYRLPYVQYTIDGIEYELQNGFASFQYLQQFYLYDLPASVYSINGQQGGARGTKRLKTQTLRFPVLIEPDFNKLVKTNLGEGSIEKMSISLLSRNANTTLRYDTEQQS